MDKRFTGSLLNLVEKTAFEHAVFLTYTLDLPFFERSALRHLLRKRCNNIAVFADATHVANELGRLGESVWASRDWMFGRDYSLTSIRHTSAFHPKIALLVGDEIELLIGSANLEPGGMRANLEIFHQISSNRNGAPNSDARSLITQAWEYVTQEVATRIPSVVKEQLRRVEEFVPWINKVESAGAQVRLVTGPKSRVVDILRGEIGKDRVRELVILSPFFDAKLKALKQLVSALRPGRTVLLIQPETVSLPGDQRGRIRNLDFYGLQELHSGYAHAKIVIAECTTKSILLAGSHNVSTPAFDGLNFEASLLRVDSARNPFTEQLKLAELMTQKNRIDPKSTLLVLRRRDEAPASQPDGWLVAAQVDGCCVEVITHHTVDTTSRLVPFQKGRVLAPLTSQPTVDGHCVKFPLINSAAASEWTAVSVLDGKIRSAPVPLVHVQNLVERGKSTSEGRIRAFISGGYLDISNLPDLLKEFGTLLMSDEATEEHIAKVRPIPHVKTPRPENQPGSTHLKYEDFVIPWKPLPSGASSTDRMLSGLELIVAACAHAAGGTRRPIQQPEEATKPSDDDDEDLADRSIYAEEALVGGRLEQDDTAVTDLEYKPSKEQIGMGTDVPASGLQEKGADDKTKLKGARRIKKHLTSFAQNFPKFLEYRCKQQAPIDLIDRITVAGRLMTSLVGRKQVIEKDTVELLDWVTWCEFHVALLGAMSSGKTTLMTRFSWEQSTLEYHRRIVERFVGYLAALEALCRSHARYVNPELRAYILIGVVRICRILGIDRNLMRDDVVKAEAAAVFDTMGPDFNPPAVDWEKWVNRVGQIRDADLSLRSQFHNLQDVVRSAAGAARLVPGEWVWQPQGESHVAIVARTFGNEAEIAWEPMKSARADCSLLIRITDAT